MAYDLPLALEQLTREGRILSTDNWGPRANTGTPYADFVAAWVGPSVVPTEQELQSAFDRIPLPREPRPLWGIRVDILNMTTTAQKNLIWADLTSGIPQKMALDEGPNAASIWVMEWSATFGTAVAADKTEAKLRVIAFYTQDNPLYLVNPAFDPTINVPGDQPVGGG